MNDDVYFYGSFDGIQYGDPAKSICVKSFLKISDVYIYTDRNGLEANRFFEIASRDLHFKILLPICNAIYF